MAVAARAKLAGEVRETAAAAAVVDTRVMAMAMVAGVVQEEALVATAAMVATAVVVDWAGPVEVVVNAVAAAAAAAAAAVVDSRLRFRHRGRRWACVVGVAERAVAPVAVGHLVVEETAVEAGRRVGAAAVVVAVAVAAVVAVAVAAVVAVAGAAVVAVMAAGSRTACYLGRTRRNPNST